MQPVSVILLLGGYGLCLPLAGRLNRVVADHRRLAFAGHQAGLVMVIMGWLSRSSLFVATIHFVWLVGAAIWFRWVSGRSGPP